MTLAELKGRYAQLSLEIDMLGSAGDPSEAKLARLTLELDEIDREYVALRRRVAMAPTLNDVVGWDEQLPAARAPATISPALI